MSNSWVKRFRRASDDESLGGADGIRSSVGHPLSLVTAQPVMNRLYVPPHDASSATHSDPTSVPRFLSERVVDAVSTYQSEMSAGKIFLSPAGQS